MQSDLKINIEGTYCYKVIDPLSTLNKYHDAINIELSSNHEKFIIYTEQTFNYKKANYEEIIESLQKLNWDSILDNKYDLNTLVDKFYTKIFEIISGHVPIKTLNNSIYPKWFNRLILKEIENKKVLHKEFKIRNF